MSVAEPSLTRAREALGPIAASLEAGGYAMEISEAEAGAGLALTVVPGPDACVECLAPRALLEGMAAQALASAGLDQAVEVSYPAGSTGP